jgi:hypothetical protein
VEVEAPHFKLDDEGVGFIEGVVFMVDNDGVGFGEVEAVLSSSSLLSSAGFEDGSLEDSTLSEGSSALVSTLLSLSLSSSFQLSLSLLLSMSISASSQSSLWLDMLESGGMMVME